MHVHVSTHYVIIISHLEEFQTRSCAALQVDQSMNQDPDHSAMQYCLSRVRVTVCCLGLGGSFSSTASSDGRM
jgi:hypothetical protein